ncbi:MFS transporter [Apiospora saccharicola]|uniref:MFS transporter n=1 Tax=Apiospora saccharicola TaxID=335842 RepID=A0ABR1VT80_9PEZI
MPEKEEEGPYQPTSYDGEVTPSEAPYSVLSASERRLLTGIIGFSMLFSPLSANIYFPAMEELQMQLRTSAQNINLTITAYLVFQAVAPALLGDLADTVGRRPVFLLMFAIYAAANVGLALQSDFVALLLLRMLQSLGCSATVSVSYGVVADVATASERGGMLGFAMIATNLGPALAPLIGGALIAGLGWRSVFWFLTICGVAVLLVTLLFLPETARRIVGDGRVLPRRNWRRPLVSVLTRWKIPHAAVETHGVETSEQVPSKTRFPNPLRSVIILLDPEAALVASMSAVFYTIYYCIQSSMSAIFSDLYGFRELIIGACYLSIGCGVVAGGISNGKLMDWNFRRVAQSAGFSRDHKTIVSLSSFPVEKARLRLMFVYTLVCSGFLAGYGWAVAYQAHISVLLTLQFGLGFITTCIVQTFNTLLVDIFQERPSAAAASGNIMRCGAAAGGVAAMSPIVERLGYGWFFSILAFLSALSGAGGTKVLLLKGMRWRTKRVDTGRSEPGSCG